MKLQPITIETDNGNVTLECKHKDIWPPGHARLDSSPERLRASGAVSETKYQQLQTWEKLCGLMEMKAEKCSQCPLALYQNRTGHLVQFAPGTEPQKPLPPSVRARKGRDVR